MSIKENLIFGLDIGTRNVVGIVGRREEEDLVIMDWEVQEHEPRAMIDGQIHDIKKAAKAIKGVKDRLEKRLETSLESVSIAAAGRVLKTLTTEVYIDFDEETTIEKQHIQSLELTGIERAQEKIKTNEGDSFFCVGYNVITYYLNTFEMENLEAHRGKRIGIKILTTFLPQVVIDSLYTAVHEAGLQVDHLSLEPIAAINAAIPQNYRMLNLALVDIGAGTSDIAITKGGSVTAYGMIPKAGDEITEQLIHKYLIDFDTAENMKLRLHKDEQLTYKDILGMEHEITSKAVLRHLKPIMDNITDAIAHEMLALNGDQAPNAVFCVGGGGQIPGFTQLLAKKLSLPKERVVLKGINDLLHVTFESDALSTPHMVTPVGICTTAMEHQRENFSEVYLNETPLKLFNAKALTVIDAALKHGYDYQRLMARKGKDLYYTLNGKKKKLRGQLGIPAEIYVNQEEGSLHTEIQNGDYILIREAVQGKDAKGDLSDILAFQNSYRINDLEVTVNNKVLVNGEEIKVNQPIQNQDIIEYKCIDNIKELLEILELPYGTEYYINGIPCDVETSKLSNNDHLEYSYIDEVAVTEEEVTTVDPVVGHTPEAIPHTIEELSKEIVENSKVHIPGTDNFLSFDVTVNGEKIHLQGKKDYIFVDIFEFYKFDLAVPKGRIQLKLNGQKAAYTDKLQPMDELEIFWE